ncbi:fungal-specific transcription factor domain-containing protein [Boeremia exigua]|uniref:fungal-specific transcription factor domain-containing protein n=1 Tax=Boeremia exigua TaxID=749465 RepID=UPI001E8D2849|nr:fungal-specific transcription factor domain-containing protein [Boeremia exigua]KAH6644252.1 fungal-specific transcription factor domain-containing protein [Boeremia exigua]
MKTAESGEKKAQRQCWECLKRRLVCDHTLPHCKKCIKAGKECPGYDEQKPLQWVETGKVTSRRRKKDVAPKVYAVRPKKSESVVPPVTVLPVPVFEELDTFNFTDPITQDDSPTLEWPNFQDAFLRPDAVGSYKSQLANLLVQEENAAWWHSLTVEEQADHIETMARKTSANYAVADRIMRIGGRRNLEAMLKRGHAHEAAALMQSDQDPLEKLRRLLWIMEMNQLPSYDYLSNETTEVVQSVNYFNTRVLPNTKAADTLAPNPALIHFPLWALHVLPPAMHHTLVCLGLNHYIHSLPPGSNRAVVASNRSKVYKYRGLAIRALSENVAKETTRSSDLTISSILMFMSMEVQNSSSGDWRSHAHGMKRLIDMRGGFGPLILEAPYLTSALVIFVIIVTFSNSLGPAANQINITEPLEQHIKEVEQVYSLIFPYVLCPPTLFVEVIRINHLRQEVTASPFETPVQHSLDAHDILARIEAFVPEDWAQPGEHNDDWQLIGSIYQATIALFCTMSLEGIGALPSSLEMSTMRTIHATRLLADLKTASHSLHLVKFSLFPLAVLGVEAGYHDRQSTRVWIERRLEEHSVLLGTSSPLKAQAVLRRYWARGEPGWDECFDSPYVFIL